MSSDDDPPESESSPHITAVVLAAGLGKRLHSNVPKPAFPVCGRAMASHVIHALGDAGIGKAVAVVPPGERGELVREALAHDAGNVDLRFAVQQEPRGTADAVLAARAHVETSHVLVVNGDLPLLAASHVRPLLKAGEFDAALATARVNDPARMGRILRGQEGSLEGIVEWQDASKDERAIVEVNLGFYLFSSDFFWPEIERIVESASGEAYATNVLPAAVARGSAVAIEVDLAGVRLNVETPADAADAEDVIRNRVIGRLSECGVHIPDRRAVWIDARAIIEPGAVLEPGSHIRGRTTVATRSRIGPNAVVRDSTIGRDCILESCTVRGSILRDEVEVGPYSTVRPGCTIESRAHIGTHAELKESRIGEGVQIGHFSYLGDADVGQRANIGAGAITCNFDGESKHRTIIGEDAFIGSDTMLVAPVVVGARARTGAGAVVTKDVPDDGNAVGHPARLTPSRRSQRDSEPAS